MISLTIDGHIIHVEPETSIFEAAQKLGIHIPTLCHHEAIKPYGACRLCMVEVIKNRRSRLVTSCNYPAEANLEVRTSSERVKNARKMILELLLARCPEVPTIQELAKQMGIKTPRFKKAENMRCILCGLCVRACEEIVGVSAISFINRGTDREVNTPFQIESDVCIGCGACTYICPASCIEMVSQTHGLSGQSLKMGDLKLYTCPNNYQCDTCETDHQFFEEMKIVMKSVRQND